MINAMKIIIPRERERVSWEERERIVGLGEQGSLLCEDDLSDKI